MSEDEQPIVTVDDLKRATWRHAGRASGTEKGVRFSITLAETTINGVTVRGSKQEWSDGRKLATYGALGKINIGSLEELAAVLSRRWEAGDDREARDD